MSLNGMGGKEYDDLLRGIEEHPAEMPAVLICSNDTLTELTKQFNSRKKFVDADRECVGSIIGIPVWMDNRFEQPVLVSGL